MKKFILISIIGLLLPITAFGATFNHNLSYGICGTDVRQLYEAINDERNTNEKLKRQIVGLIFKLCQKNGFKGLSEYDIDQAFPESRQTPIAGAEEIRPVIATSLPITIPPTTKP